MQIKRQMGGIFLAAAMLSAATAAQAGGITVTHAWVRLLPGDLPAAGYFTLHNGTTHPILLEGVRSPVYASAMMHRSDMQSGRMLPLQRVTVPSNGTLQFQPDGYHIMFRQSKAPLRPGSHVPVVLLLGGGQAVKADFIAKGATGQ